MVQNDRKWMLTIARKLITCDREADLPVQLEKILRDPVVKEYPKFCARVR